MCDEGNNRSVHFAHLLKYWGNDVLSLGLKTNDVLTKDMLYDWADIIVLTAKGQHVPSKYRLKTLLLDVGPDKYPRPFNPALRSIATRLLAAHRELLDHSPNGAIASV